MIAFIDTEVNPQNHEIEDYGAVREDGAVLHSHSRTEFFNFLSECGILCGHNIINHDLNIGDFIRDLQEKKQQLQPIAVSCFTATAKPKVVSDICKYFKEKLDIELHIFAAKADRKNLHYSVLHAETEEEKYAQLRNLIRGHNCPSIVYVSRTRRTWELSGRLGRDGIAALPFNGKMEAAEKVENQNAFMSGKAQVIVATSAFGMGVDKKDVGLVVHYDISDSLENYIQEAGRAGRDPQMEANCYVLYSDSDLDKHFILLNQTKLSLSEIQQVWKAIKELTKKREKIIHSLISSRATASGRGAEAESRIDYLADILGMTKEAVVRSVNLMRQEGILADAQDMKAYLDRANIARGLEEVLKTAIR